MVTVLDKEEDNWEKKVVVQMSRKKDLRDIVESIVSISDFSRGKTSKIIQKVNEQNEEYIIVKNNEPQAVLMSVSGYTSFMNDRDRLVELEEKLEQLELLLTLEERLKDHDPADALSEQEVYEKLEVSKQRVQHLAEKLEID